MAEAPVSSEIKDEELEQISTVVSKAMFYTMASRYKSRGQMNSILTLEFLYTARNRGAIQRYYGGSAAEGSNLPDSDVDKMIVAPNITVCRNKETAQTINGHVFMSDTSGCQPGYTKLIPVKLEATEPTLFDYHNKTIQDMLQMAEDGKAFLSSDKIVQFWMNFLTKRNISAPTPEYRHGPCATAVTRDTFGYIKNELGAEIEQDFAHALSFNDWPEEADEWLVRKRKHGWPSRDMIEKIKRLKCHVVAVGDRMSSSSSLEWRISFLLAERALVWNFNDVQMQCYVLLKKILKVFLNPVAPDELSSYHMKTIVFWKSENNPPDVWQQKYLLLCVRKCLVFLKESIEESKLRHYIDQGKNLFLWKLQEKAIKDSVIECINGILADFVTSVLQCVDGIDLLSTWLTSEKDVANFLQLCRDTKDPRITIAFDEYKNSLKVYHFGQASFGVDAETVLADFKCLALYREAYNEEEPSSDIDHHFTKSVQMYINIRIAMILIKQLLGRNPSKAETRNKLERLRTMLEDNSDIDAISGRLYLATYFVKMESYQEASSVISKILYSETRNLVYTGLCSKYHTIVISNGTATQRKRLPSSFDYHIPYLSTAQDLLFSKEDLSFVPYVLKFECMTDGLFLLHPLVYLFYLAFLSSDDKEKGQYLSALEAVVDECKTNMHGYRNFNILGYCYYVNGDYRRAIECFTRSLGQTALTKRQNAVIYHLIILVYRLLPSGYDKNAECIYSRQ